MLKNIIIDKTWASNLTLIIGNDKKYLSMNEKEILAAKKEQQEAHKHHVDCFRDVEGNAYVCLHGGFIQESDGKIIGFLDFRGDEFTRVEDVYDNLVKESFISKGEKLNIICCYGKAIGIDFRRRIDEGKTSSRSIHIVNNTMYECWSSASFIANGNIRYTVGTRESKRERFLYEIARAF